MRTLAGFTGLLWFVAVSAVAGGMYVRDIRPRVVGPDLATTVTVYQDADRDGVAEFYDDPLPDATVGFTLRRDTDGDGTFDCGPDECRSFTGTTGDGGQVEFRWESAPPGDYEAQVTSLGHERFAWDTAIETDERDYLTVR